MRGIWQTEVTIHHTPPMRSDAQNRLYIMNNAWFIKLRLLDLYIFCFTFFFFTLKCQNYSEEKSYHLYYFKGFNKSLNTAFEINPEPEQLSGQIQSRIVKYPMRSDGAFYNYIIMRLTKY